MPRVSVIIPCYNYARYLTEAVESVLAQTYPDLEVVIVNDGSTDDTLAVAKSLIEHHPGRAIRLVDQANSGLPTARNNGIREAAGEYILPLDADDTLAPLFLERLVPVIDADPGVGLAYSWGEKFGGESGVMRHGGFTLRNLIVRDGPPQSPLFRRSAWERVGGYKPVMRHGGEDWEFSCSLYEAGYKGVVVPEVMYYYRRHGPSMIDNMVNHHAVESSRDIKLLHPAMFEPQLSKINVRLARAVIWLKSWLRDPFTHFVYVRFPGLHSALSRIKYDVFGFLWKG